MKDSQTQFSAKDLLLQDLNMDAENNLIDSKDLAKTLRQYADKIDGLLEQVKPNETEISTCGQIQGEVTWLLSSLTRVSTSLTEFKAKASITFRTLKALSKD